MTNNQDQINNFVGLAHGDFSAVKKLLAEDPSLLNARAVWDETAIQAATQMGRVDIIEHLLAAGAPKDIFTAAVLGQKDEVAGMLKTDPDLAKAPGVHGFSLLYFPVIRGFKEIAELVLAHGAPVNSGEGGTTPLHGAVEFNQVEMAAWLLDQGANIEALNYGNKTSLAIAREKQYPEMTDLLLSRGAKE
jgi:ankyrin repeat protein